MTVKEAAEQLELSLWTVYKLLQSGKLGCQRIGPGRGRVVISEDHIKHYRESCEYVMPLAEKQERHQRGLLMNVAHTATTKAIKSGELRRQPCEKCGNKNVHAHHDDYTKSLEVRWLCPKHHKQIHDEMKKEKRTAQHDLSSSSRDVTPVC